MSIIRHVVLWFVCILALMFSITSSSSAATRRVDANVTPGGAEDGTSWPDAYPDLQPAIEDSVDGDVIWVAGGLYIPSVPEPSTSTDARHWTFKLKNGVKIYGGFMGQDRPDGGETELSQRGYPHANLTLLSGLVGQPLPSQPGSWPVCGGGGSCVDESLGLGCVDVNCCKAVCNQIEECCTEEWGLDCSVIAIALNCPGNLAFHVVRSMSGVTESSTLDGFTIALGRANGGSAGPQADRKGGGLLIEQSNPVIANIDFQANQAAVSGGSAHVSSGGLSEGDSSNPVRFINCRFLSGHSNNVGGGLGNAGSVVELMNVFFFNNSAKNDGGGMFNDASSDVRTVNVTFVENEAGTDGTGTGGGVAVGGFSEFLNIIAWGNTAGSAASTEEAQISASVSLTTVSHSCIEGLDEFAGNNNIGDDPLFVASTVALQTTSPCRDAGDNRAGVLPDDFADLDYDGITAVDTPLDLNFKPRVAYGGIANKVDMGAFELQLGVPCPADFNGDCVVNGFDLAILLGAWGPTSPCPPHEDADLDFDCDVDGFDLGVLLGDWGPCAGDCEPESLLGGGGESATSGGGGGGGGGEYALEGLVVSDSLILWAQQADYPEAVAWWATLVSGGAAGGGETQ